MNILITGRNGQLGSEIHTISPQFDAQFFFADSTSGDITNKALIDTLVCENNIGMVINCAAYTAVDAAENDEKNAFAVNELGVQNLVEVCSKHAIRLIHISTDYVFDGTSTTPYKPADPVSPLGVYGTSKRAGENAILKSTVDAVIVRTSWVYSSFGKNFVKTMLFHGNQKEQLNVVDDQKGCPTYARDLADTVVSIALKKEWPQQQGIYHYSNEGAITWCEFATEIMLQAKLNCRILPIPTEDYPTPAERPKYSVLDCSDIQRDFAITIPNWKDALKNCLRAIQYDLN